MAVYDSFIKKQEIYAEDIEEAIFQYLVKEGFMTKDEDGKYSYQYQDTDGKWVTTKCLKIRWR